MPWTKHKWDTKDAYIKHTDAQYYWISSDRFTEGTDRKNWSWFEHLSEKAWITIDDLWQLLEIFCQQYPEHTDFFEQEYEKAIKLLYKYRR